MAQNDKLEYIYLVDANNNRQYALGYDASGWKSAKVFAVNGSEIEFDDGETIFAFDDAIKIDYAANNIPTFTASAYRLDITKVNGANKISVRTVDNIEFKTTIGVKSDFALGQRFVAYMRATNPSVLTQLKSKSMDALPIMFTHYFKEGEVKDNNDDSITIQPEAIQALCIPPQHNGGALIARTAMEQVIAEEFNAPAKNTSAAFNKTQPVNKARVASMKPIDSGFKVSDSDMEAIIKKYCDDLTEKAEKGKLDPVVGRDQEVEDSLTIMLRREQASLCFTGDAGVGKSAMFAAIAQRLADNKDLPASMQDARVLQLDLQGMNAGAQFRGQFEQRLKPLIDGLQEREGWFKGRKIYLAIDEIHAQLTAGKAEGGSDAGNMMKPFMAAKGITVLGTTTTDEYRKHIEKDPALARRFEEKVLEQPSEADTFKILKQAVWPMMKDHHGLTTDLSDDDFHYVITMSNRYAPNESQPAKGKKVIDMAAASAQKRGDETVTREDVIKAVAQMSKLPEDFLNKKDYERLTRLEEELSDAVLGQDNALKQISDTLIGSLSGLKDPNTPMGAFFLQGPPGVGKTETAKALARLLFGSEDALIKLDMSEYAEKHEVAKLTGAPPGYVGYDDGKPALTDSIRSRPYSVLLLDEAEKAHPDVWNILLAPMNDGEMKDNKGKVASFRNVLILFTSNLGAKDALAALSKSSNALSFSRAAMSDDEVGAGKEKVLEEVYTAAIKKHFRPEFIDRVNMLGGFVTYRPLVAETINKLTTRALQELDTRLSDRAGANLAGVHVEFSKDIMDQLANEGYVPDAGARPLKALIRRKITNPLAGWLLRNKEELASFAAKNGGARLVIESLEDFAPQIKAPAEKAPAVSNDNVVVDKLPKKTATRKSGRKPN